MRKRAKYVVVFLLFSLLLTGCKEADEALGSLVDALFDIKQAATLTFNPDSLAGLLRYLRPLAVIAVLAFDFALLQSACRGENILGAFFSRHIKWFGVLLLLGTPIWFFSFVHQLGQEAWPAGLTTSFVAKKMGILSISLGSGPLAVVKLVFVVVAFIVLVLVIAQQVVVQASVLLGYPVAVILCIPFRSLKMMLCWSVAFIAWFIFAPVWYNGLQLMVDMEGLLAPVVFALFTGFWAVLQLALPLIATVTVLYQEIVSTIIPRMPFGSDFVLDFVQTLALLSEDVKSRAGNTSGRAGSVPYDNSDNVVDGQWRDVDQPPRVREVPVAGFLGPGSQSGGKPSDPSGGTGGAGDSGTDPDKGPLEPPHVRGSGLQGDPEGGSDPEDPDEGSEDVLRAEKDWEETSRQDSYLEGVTTGTLVSGSLDSGGSSDDETQPPQVHEMPAGDFSREELPSEDIAGKQTEKEGFKERLREETADALEQRGKTARTVGGIAAPIVPEAGVPLMAGGTAVEQSADSIRGDLPDSGPDTPSVASSSLESVESARRGRREQDAVQDSGQRGSSGQLVFPSSKRGGQRFNAAEASTRPAEKREPSVGGGSRMEQSSGGAEDSPAPPGKQSPPSRVDRSRSGSREADQGTPPRRSSLATGGGGFQRPSDSRKYHSDVRDGVPRFGERSISLPDYQPPPTRDPRRVSQERSLGSVREVKRPAGDESSENPDVPRTVKPQGT